MINMNKGELIAYVMSNIGNETIGDFVKTNKINQSDSFSIILKNISSESIDKIVRTMGEPVFDGEDLQWLCKDYIMQTSVRHTDGLTELYFTIYCNVDSCEGIKKSIREVFKGHIANLEGIVQASVHWYFMGHNGMDSHELTEIIKEKVHPEAYPEIDDLDAFISGYFRSKSPIMILTGPPGTGKSRLIRYIVMKYALMNDDEVGVMYTSDMNLLETQESFFISFMVGDHKFMILEDIDAFLAPRKEGNNLMHKFLSASDGFIRCDDKKIIMTTNLSMNEIDEALIRPGRCYANRAFVKLNRAQAMDLASKINSKKTWTGDGDFRGDRFSIAEIYDIAEDKNESQHLGTNRTTGFQSGNQLRGPRRENTVARPTESRGRR